VRTRNGRQFSFTTYDWNLVKLQEVRHRVGGRTMAVRKTDPGVREQFKGIETLPVRVQPTPATRELLDLITERARDAHTRGEGLAPHYLLARIACINPGALRHSSSPEAAQLLADRPDLLDAGHSAKIEVLNGLLEEIGEAQDKAVVFCHWTELGLLRLAPHITVPHVLHYGTGQTARESQAAQDRFKSDPGITAFCSSDAGTHGLNLQEARYVINVDPTYSYDDLAQRNARIDRADSHLDGLTAYVLITEDSVEERVWEVCESRRRLAAAVQGTQEELSYGDRPDGEESRNLEWLLFGGA
jgi:SNF2 family DNA or RNA helicase